MRFVFVLIIVSGLSACNSEKYPLHDELKKSFDSISNTHTTFMRIRIMNGVSDTLVLSKDEFSKFAEQFLREFPLVSDQGATVIEDDHKYQGKRKIYDYGTKKIVGEMVNISVILKINDKGEEILDHASYTRYLEEDKPNPTKRLAANLLARSFTVQKKNADYFQVIWEK